MLVERPGVGLVISRVSIWTRLAARLRFASLDEALADGAEPESRPALALRAQRLISPRMRRQLASSLRWYADQARRRRAQSRATFPAAAPPPHASGLHVAGAADELLKLADLLEGSEPVDARGVALACVLLTDGGSPLHRNLGAKRLAAMARAAGNELAPRTPAAA